MPTTPGSTRLRGDDLGSRHPHPGDGPMDATPLTSSAAQRAGRDRPRSEDRAYPGTLGVVYEAEQLSLSRHVALKVLPRNMLWDAKAKWRFEREAKSAAKLHHTNIGRSGWASSTGKCPRTSGRSCTRRGERLWFAVRRRPRYFRWPSRP